MELEISVWVFPKQSILHLNTILIYLLILRMSCMSTVFKTFLAILPKFRYSCVLPITLYYINFITSYFVIIIFILVCVYACIYTCIWKYYALSTFIVVHKYIFIIDYLELHKHLSGCLSLEKTDSPSCSRQYLQGYGEDFLKIFSNNMISMPISVVLVLVWETMSWM